MTIRKGGVLFVEIKYIPENHADHAAFTLQDQPSYTHVVSMQQEQRLWLLNYEQPDPADCICRRCAENVRKHMGEESYVPVWKKV